MPADGGLDPDWRAECAPAAPFPVLERPLGTGVPPPPPPSADERPEWRPSERTLVLELLCPGPAQPSPQAPPVEQVLELKFYGTGGSAADLLATAVLPLTLPLSINANCATHRLALFGNETAPVGTLDGVCSATHLHTIIFSQSHSVLKKQYAV